jgi:hypothetical protein
MRYRISTPLAENPRVGSSILPLSTNKIIEFRLIAPLYNCCIVLIRDNIGTRQGRARSIVRVSERALTITNWELRTSILYRRHSS